MLSFELSKAPATFENFNTRTEKIGPEKFPAADLKFTCPQAAEVLAFFSPTLRAHLFKIETDLAGEKLTVRYPHLSYPLSVDDEMSGCTLTVDYGIGKPMVFIEAKLNQFRLTPNEGGTVTVGFRAQCRPDEKQAGRLFMLQEQPLTITIEPPEEKPDLAKTPKITPLMRDAPELDLGKH